MTLTAACATTLLAAIVAIIAAARARWGILALALTIMVAAAATSLLCLYAGSAP